MHGLIDCIERSVGQSQSDSSQTAFHRREFVTISLAGDFLDSLVVFTNSSYDRILAHVAFLADCHHEAVTIPLIGVALTAEHFSLRDDTTTRRLPRVTSPGLASPLRLFASDWQTCAADPHKRALLYDIHSLDNLIRKAEEEWFAFPEARDMFEDADLVVVLAFPAGMRR
jgi:hypothetical protein